MLEPNIYGLWAGKQIAKGTPQTTPVHRFNWAAGDFNAPRDDGSEAFSDTTKYGAETDWVNSLVGNGTPGIEATPTELAFILWLFHGAETVTPVTGPPTAQKHTFVPQAGRGFYSTWYKRIGQSIIARHQFNDCLVSQVQIEGSTANKAVRVTPTILSLDPGVQGPAADPTQAMPTDKSLLYTDGTGTFTVDGVAIPAHSQFSFVANEDLQPVFGDDVVPVDLAQGTPTVTLGVTLAMTSDALAQFNKIVYGTATPSVAQKPLKAVPALGSYSFWLKQRDAAGALNGREFHLTVPGVKWAIPDFPGPNPAGGATEIALAGAMRPTAGQPPYTIDVNTNNADVAFTT